MKTSQTVISEHAGGQVKGCPNEEAIQMWQDLKVSRILFKATIV